MEVRSCADETCPEFDICNGWHFCRGAARFRASCGNDDAGAECGEGEAGFESVDQRDGRAGLFADARNGMYGTAGAVRTQWRSFGLYEFSRFLAFAG